ncbi:MAG: helix-turn-helix domain-containing protein [Lachnospiraceae bacterium]|nr:helix-turn-helix domain-containing protein [Lachnospiraceae bacterium]MDD3617357.1 helix-turn-helix domain-containing protein [Lachnospiraceae bacterium]
MSQKKIVYHEMPDCPVETTMVLVGSKWKMLIVAYLLLGTQRFMDLKRNISAITQKTLTKSLKELERDGIVRRKVYPQVPPKVEYSLTELGQSMAPIIETMCHWGEKAAEA